MENRLVDLLRPVCAWLARPSGPPPRPTRWNLVFDVVLAVALCVLSVEYALNRQDMSLPMPPVWPDFPADLPDLPDLSDVPLPPDLPRPPEERLAPRVDTFGSVVVALVASLAIALRRRFPLGVLWTVALVTLAAPQVSPRLTFYAIVIAVYTASAYSQYRVPALLGVTTAVLSVTTFRSWPLPVVPYEFIPLLVLIPIAFAANGLRTWKLRTDERTAQVSAMEREQAEALRRAVEHERARIARELHDVVTHNVSVMVIQAGAARKVMEVDADQAREALLAVESGGRAAMAELRHVMGLLTADGADADSLAPQPGLDQLAALVARVRDAGAPVELSIVGEPRDLPSGVELTAYRVVQEALTNTVKHAVGASAAVVVSYGDDELTVEVTDTGGRPGEGRGGGRGLIGLRERLGVYGGTLRTGPRVGGGFRVTAQIPLEAS
ncbi:sensor histidine kinase [Saccharothrix obliqua]|uniref:sensor histidine kinase n=1 Tax=Saccharothrix obliqua TaxID=2861747 RepID=UPI0027E3051C|nr:histidine kinase [Saccharothrix obliqua]